ncbi:chorismate-binding protein [Succinimonas amylolytica]|uniref:chorismate-binding protein n=1 Tax=Succinimonas amylolytica TaxID=83769 RepID=UPI0023A8D488
MKVHGHHSMQIFADKYFDNPAEIIEVFNPEDLKHGLDRVEQLRDSGFYLVGYLRYDLSKPAGNGMPLLYFEAFTQAAGQVPEEDCGESGNFWNAAPGSGSMPAGSFLIPLITREEYCQSIAFIREQIRNGITYEVNYTYPSILKSSLSGTDLYRHLRSRQKTPYNAFIQNRHETVMSFSPELFFRLDGRKILTRPMKGTIRRGRTPEEDAANRSFLGNDPKNRAENLMIVDLLRNDLSIIARDGTVRANRLFEIEEHPTVFQMTSDISAELRDDVSLYDIIRAVHPCGSITGAPKRSTMQVIAEIEPWNRDIYCGAIGYLHGNETVFSVAIRILQKRHEEQDYRYYAGGAVTYDSNARDEWEETLAKSRFLESGFSLIETGTGDRELHLARLRNSAKELGFAWNDNLDSFDFPADRVSRIELFRDGHFSVTSRKLPEPAVKPRVRIAGKVSSNNPFLYHKTTVRSPSPRDYFEEIRTNERNEITEGTFTNVAIRTGEAFFTPPVSSGLLNGIMRQKLIRQGVLKERILYPRDLETADAVYCLNSVRGMFEVTLCS